MLNHSTKSSEEKQTKNYHFVDCTRVTDDEHAETFKKYGLSSTNEWLAINLTIEDMSFLQKAILYGSESRATHLPWKRLFKLANLVDVTQITNDVEAETFDKCGIIITSQGMIIELDKSTVKFLWDCVERYIVWAEDTPTKPEINLAIMWKRLLGLSLVLFDYYDVWKPQASFDEFDD